MRIAFVDANVHAFYGAQRRMIVLATGLQNRHDVTLVTTGHGALAERAAHQRLRVAVLPAAARVNRFGGSVLASRGIDRVATLAGAATWSARCALWLRRQRIHVVVANDVRSCLLAGVAARLAQRPIVWSVRDDVRAGRWHGVSARLATRVVTVSDGVQTVFTPDERRALGDRLLTIYNGVPLPEPRADARAWLRREVGQRSDDERPIVALVAMLTPRKGHADAVRALAALRARGLAARLLAVGDAPEGYASYQGEVTALADQVGVSDAVHWMGFRRDALDVMAGADLVVLPSSNEGLPGVLIEALGVGVPVVTYACAGADEIVRDGLTGSIVPVGDVDALATAMADWLRDPVLRAEAGRLGRRDVRARFDVDAYVAAYEALLHGIVGCGVQVDG